MNELPKSPGWLHAPSNLGGLRSFHGLCNLHNLHSPYGWLLIFTEYNKLLCLYDLSSSYYLCSTQGLNYYYCLHTP